MHWRGPSIRSAMQIKYQGHLMTKPTKWLCPAKTQVWSESSLSTWGKLGSLATHWEHSEDSDQRLCTLFVAKDQTFNRRTSTETGQIPRLIWVFAGYTGHFVGRYYYFWTIRATPWEKVCERVWLKLACSNVKQLHRCWRCWSPINLNEMNAVNSTNYLQ